MAPAEAQGEYTSALSQAHRRTLRQAHSFITAATGRDTTTSQLLVCTLVGRLVLSTGSPVRCTVLRHRYNLRAVVGGRLHAVGVRRHTGTYPAAAHVTGNPCHDKMRE